MNNEPEVAEGLTPTDLEPEVDRLARGVGNILGPALNAQLQNAEYLNARGHGNAKSLAVLRRAAELRDQP